MDLPQLGHAIIINNIRAEVAGSASDVHALQRAYETVGFDVQVHIDCSSKVGNLVCGTFVRKTDCRFNLQEEHFWPGNSYMTVIYGKFLAIRTSYFTGRERLIRSHSSARFCFKLSGNSN